MQRSFRGISTGIAGLTDAGIAALSGFSVGVVAIVYLDAELGTALRATVAMVPKIGEAPANVVRLQSLG